MRRKLAEIRAFMENQHNPVDGRLQYIIFTTSPNLVRSAHLLLIYLSLQPCPLGKGTFGVSFVDRY